MKITINMSRCYVEWIDIGYAQRMYVCRSREYSFPLGFVIGTEHWNEKCEWTYFEVHVSFVIQWARRQGIRTMINAKIIEEFKAVTSAGATPAGRAFMKAQKYRRDPLYGYVRKR